MSGRTPPLRGGAIVVIGRCKRRLPHADHVGQLVVVRRRVSRVDHGRVQAHGKQTANRFRAWWLIRLVLGPIVNAARQDWRRPKADHWVLSRRRTTALLLGLGLWSAHVSLMLELR
jgi:hypothetical protein